MTRFAHYTPVLALLVVSLIFIATLNSSAQKAGDRRPRIGLVLSGGGARGLAHVGVIKVLEEYGIHVDYIVGTSMGSLVGGLYASGYDAVELEKTALSIDWGRYLDDRVSRRELSYDEKQDDGRFIISLPVKKGEGPKLQGIIEGIKLHAFLNRLLFHVRGTADFNELPVPFACVATDIYTGRAVILNKGHLPTALRASMAIPSIFTPVEIDGRFLVDGGLVLNFPVSVAKEMGADIIIGVDVGTPLYKEGDSLSIPEIIDQISSFRGAESTENQRRLCDILITPELEGFNSSDFDKTPELIAQGEKAARLHAEELKALAEQQNAYREEPKIIKVDKTPDKIFIKKIRFEGLKNVSKQMIKNRLQLEVPSYVTIDDIEKGITRVYGSRYFKSVTYRIEQESGADILVIHVEESAMDFLNVGIRYDSDLKAAILINTEFKNILGEGSRLDLEARLAEDPAFSLGYQSGTGWPIGFGFGTKIWYERIDVFSYLNNEVSGEYKYDTYGMGLFTRMILYHNLELGFGLKKEFMRIESVISMENFSDMTVDYLNPYIFLHIDTLDSVSFPESGIMCNAEYKYITDILSAHEADNVSVHRYFFNTEVYIPVYPRWALLFTYFFGAINGDDPPAVYYFLIGGMNNVNNIILPFTGLDYMEASGTNIHAIGAGLQFEFHKNFFIIPRYNIARIKDSTKDVLSGNIDTVYGYGASLGYRSIIGPIQLTGSHGNNHTFLYHFSIGFTF